MGGTKVTGFRLSGPSLHEQCAGDCFGQEYPDCREDEKSIDPLQLVLACTRFSRLIPRDVDRMLMPMVGLAEVVSS
jgi:hypothetical protein